MSTGVIFQPKIEAAQRMPTLAVDIPTGEAASGEFIRISVPVKQL